jgi:S-adenosylmethionine synthetase
MSDQISDAVVDAIITDDPRARIACETLLTNGICFIAGEITTKTYVDIPKIARAVIREIGYADGDCGFNWETSGVAVAIKEQSSDIARGVDSYKKKAPPARLFPKIWKIWALATKVQYSVTLATKPRNSCLCRSFWPINFAKD